MSWWLPGEGKPGWVTWPGSCCQWHCSSQTLGRFSCWESWPCRMVPISCSALTSRQTSLLGRCQVSPLPSLGPCRWLSGHLVVRRALSLLLNGPIRNPWKRAWHGSLVKQPILLRDWIPPGFPAIPKCLKLSDAWWGPEAGESWIEHGSGSFRAPAIPEPVQGETGDEDQDDKLRHNYQHGGPGEPDNVIQYPCKGWPHKRPQGKGRGP